VLLLIAVFALTGLGGDADALRPGGQLGGTLLVRGTAPTANQKLFDICDPVIVRSGRFTRRCGAVARVKRLFIGYGSFALPRQINKVWKASTWAAWLDGRPIDLTSFGTSDRPLYAFPPAGGKTVTLREWRVTLVSASPGRHTIRYRFRDGGLAIDATWIFTVTAT
jgi:hypothetical protein